VDLAAGRLTVADSKTPSGVRYVELLAVVRDDLAAHKATLSDVTPDALMFPTSTGKLQGKDNARNRIFAPAVRRANERLAEAALTPLPEGLTPHSLRRTCCSLRVAISEDLAYIAEQLGHAHDAPRPHASHEARRRVPRASEATRGGRRVGANGRKEAHRGAVRPGQADNRQSENPSVPATSGHGHGWA
jgi:integrase